MPIIDAYETTYGKVINKNRIVKEIRDYVLQENLAFNYEYQDTPNAKLVLITGYNKEEKDLTIFDHPLIFQGLKDEYFVAVDVRKFLKIDSEEQPMRLEEYVKDQAGFDFSILRGLLTIDFINHDYGNLRQIYGGISLSYAGVITTLLNIYIKLNPDEKVMVELACAYFSSCLFHDLNDVDDNLSNILARVSNYKYSGPLTKNTVFKTLESVSIKDQTIYSLISCIQQVLPEEKANILNDSILVNLLSNIWYGPGGNESLIIGLEHLPTWIAVVYVSIANMTYKRARLSNMLNMYSKQIDNKGYIKEIELYLKEKTL